MKGKERGQEGKRGEKKKGGCGKGGKLEKGGERKGQGREGRKNQLIFVIVCDTALPKCWI